MAFLLVLRKSKDQQLGKFNLNAITMKNKISLAFLTLISFAFIFNGCSGIKQMKQDYNSVEVYTEPEVLEVHGDTVQFTIKGNFPPKYFDKKGMIKFTPSIRYQGGSKNFDGFYLKGEKVELADDKKNTYNVIKTISYQDGGSFERDYKIPYKKGMENSLVESAIDYKIDSEFDELDKCMSKEESDSITAGTITTPLSVKPKERMYLGGVSEKDKTAKEQEMEEKYGPQANKQSDAGKDLYRPKSGVRKPYDGVVKPADKMVTATIFFEINDSRIRQSEKEGEAMEKVESFTETSQLRLNNIFIKSYASPDGELELNENLTQERANSTHDYLSSFLKQKGFESVHDTDFNKRATTEEDWSGFKKMIQQSDLDAKGKILDIANSNLPLDEKESSIRELDAWEPYITEEIMPELRRSHIKVKGFIEVQSLEDIRQLAEDHGLDTLNKQEKIKLAYHSNDINRKREIYQHYTEEYPDDWVGYNNLGVLLLYEARYEEARESFLQYAKRFPEVPEIQNNLGVANSNLKHYDSARDNYMAAQQGGLSVGNNLGILDIKVGDYESAINNFPQNQCDYNVALAYTLNENYEMAKNKIECIVDKKADHFYLRAIVAARNDNTELMTTSLTRAVELKEDYRSKAKNDIEFRDYHGTPKFKNALR